MTAPLGRRHALGLIAAGAVAGCSTTPPATLAAATLAAALADAPPLPALPAVLAALPLARWCRAGTGMVLDEAGGVAAWRDLAGRGNHLTQAAPGRRPTLAASAVNGLPAVSFDGIGQFLDNPHLGEPACEILVARLRVGTVPRRVRYALIGADGLDPGPGPGIAAYELQALAGTDDFDRRLAYVRCRADGADPIRLQSQPVIGAWGILAVRNDGRSVRLYKSNLRCDAADTAAVLPIARAAIGCGFRDHRPAHFAPADIAETLSFSEDLSDAQFVAVLNMLRGLYDLGVSAASGDVLWPVFQGNGVDERGLNDNLVLLQGDGERFRYRPSHYLPPAGSCVRDPSMAPWRGAMLLAHTMISRSPGTVGRAYFALAVSRDGVASFSPAVTILVDQAVATDSATAEPANAVMSDSPTAFGAAGSRCWAPAFVRNRDNSPWLLDGRPVVLCNVSPGHPPADNDQPGMQYYLFTPSDDDLVAPWTLLGRLAGLPPNIIDGALVHDPSTATWYVSVTQCNPPQHARLFASRNMLGDYAPVGDGDDPYDFGASFEGTSLFDLGGDRERYFLDARGAGYLFSDNARGLRADGWSTPRPVVAPFIPQHGTPLPTPPDICTL